MPPIHELISGLPSSCFGMKVVWSRAEDPSPVFIESFELDEGGNAYVYGTRYDIAGALFDGDSLGDGHVVEYFVVTGGPSAWRCSRLMQHEDVVYSAPLVPIGHVPAVQVEAGDSSMRKPPRWISRSAAIWPTYADEPMVFVGQVTQPANDAKATLRPGVTLYLFRARDREDRFALVDQDGSEQSAEEHYAIEEEFD